VLLLLMPWMWMQLGSSSGEGRVGVVWGASCKIPAPWVAVWLHTAALMLMLDYFHCHSVAVTSLLSQHAAGLLSNVRSREESVHI
jgi:hypothetical protein